MEEVQEQCREILVQSIISYLEHMREEHGEALVEEAIDKFVDG